MSEQLRVALLARAGAARDQLRKALEEVGAAIVAEGDPGELDPKDVAEKLPKVYLVGLEPATEKAIDRFDSLFEAEGVEVMFDDAEVTAKLDGWDLNRGARHLAGKLTGREILPPVPEGAPAIGEFVEPQHDAGAMLMGKEKAECRRACPSSTRARTLAATAFAVKPSTWNSPTASAGATSACTAVATAR